MTQAAHIAPGGPIARSPAWECPSFLANTRTIAAKELREAFRSRWFLLYTIAFTCLGLAVSYLSGSSAGSAGLSGFGRTTAGLVNIVLLVVPLMALTAGACAIASDRDRGVLAYLLAQPVTRIEVLAGKYLALSAALIASICLGLGCCAAVLAWKAGAAHPATIVWFAGLSVALALGMLSVGMLISVLSRKASVAIGAAVFVWLVFVFVSDLGLMAGAVALKLRIETLFAISLANPVQVFKMWSLQAIDVSLDVLGPAGLYATDEFASSLNLLFGSVLAAWVCVPLFLAGLLFSRKTPL